MRIAVTGGGGQLGRAIQAALGNEHDVRCWTRADVDVTDAEAVLAATMSIRPDAIVHAAAWTDVDGCELDPERAHAVHVAGTEAVARAARKAQAHLVSVSTDLVFDGTLGRPYVEEDETNPIQVYGRTKLQAETVALAVAPRCTVVRTAWLYDLANPQGFALAILERARQGDPFPVVADQVGSPTGTAWFAARIGEIIETRTFGLLHRAEPVVESRASFARRLVGAHGIDPGLVVEARVADLPPRPAARPPYAPLASTRDLAELPHAHDGSCDC